jgi:adenylosuccinate synthase
MGNLIILGSQWGDEGKGKLVDLLADQFDFIARFQGGHNAGHTIQIGDRKFVLKLIPSGILRPGKIAVIGNGLVIDPVALFTEIDQLMEAGIDVPAHLRISNRAHILLPAHRAMEKRIFIGTTSRGIGPCYEDKAGRRGLRVADLIDQEQFNAHFDDLAREHETVLRAFDIEPDYDREEVRAQYLALADRIRPMVCDTAVLLNRAIQSGKKVLFEGAQATMLDIDHGTYPYVTSSSASAGGACIGTGVAPTLIDAILGVAKAYITRVGGGPFPTEVENATGDEIRRRGNEFGSVTGRPRRCGWFDAPLLRYTAVINHFDSLVITKLDILDHLDQIPVCTAYRIGSKVLDEMPATSHELAAVEPVYDCLPGWQQDTSKITSWDKLPPAARRYLDFLEQAAEVEVGCVSLGPERDQTIVRPGSRFEEVSN